MIYTEFYSELGKLLYAVADQDGIISQKEKKKLQDLIKNELVPTENHQDQFGTNAAYFSEIEFDFLEEEMVDTEAAFNSFNNFVEDHHTAFSENMKKICLQLAREIAEAYHGTNKKEQALVDKLKKNFERIFIREKVILILRNYELLTNKT